MAGYVKLQRSIWQDIDFLALEPLEQRLYMLLISQGDISHVGVLPLTPGRWARLSVSTTVETIRASLDKLAAGNFIVYDPDTEELLVRTYLLHDGAFKLTNGKTSLLMAYDRVHSNPLRRVVAMQLSTVGVTVPSTVGATVEPSQQPAAIPTSHDPAASSKGRPGMAADAESDSADDASAAALELLIDHRVRTTAKTNPQGLRRALERQFPDEHGPALQRYIQNHPTATAQELAVKVLNVPGIELPPPPPAFYADPHCIDCPGDGTANLAPEGAPAEYGPCACRRTTPYPMADVIEFPGNGAA